MVLDTRTQREFDSNRGPARLMDSYGLGWLHIAWADLMQRPENSGQGDLPVIIVSASPVHGFEPLEFLQKLSVDIGFKRPAEVDFESWIGNREGFGSLMRTLAVDLRPRWCLFLSGDVHYSFTNRAEFVSDGRTLPVWQATSSPLRGMAKGLKILEKFSRVAERTEHRFGWREGSEVPLFYRLIRPIIALSVRLNLGSWNSSERPIWTDTVWGISPQGHRELIRKENNLGIVRFRDGEPEVHELVSSDSEVTEALKFVMQKDHGDGP